MNYEPRTGLVPQGRIVGIDLGTTNSLIGLYDAGFPILLANAEGSRLTPSVVSYSTPSAPLVGHAAERQQLLYPDVTVASVKRLIGRRIGDPECAGWSNLVGIRGEAFKIKLGERLVTPEEVSSEILKELKAMAEAHLGASVTRAIITVPAYFNDAQRQATRRAGELAGFNVERIISEPTAAALAYGLDKLQDHSKIAVYDFGGGTFDLSILKLDQGVFQVLSTCGDTNLGGDLIDQALTEFLLAKLQLARIFHADLLQKPEILMDTALSSKSSSDSVYSHSCGQTSSLALSHQTLQLPHHDQHEISGLGKNPDSKILVRLRQAARQAKEELSSVEETVLRFPFLEGTQSQEIRLTRTELEKIALPIIERTRALSLRSLSDAGLLVEELDEIILVGGSTRMPAVRTFVEQLFKKPPNLSQHPDEAVALGAILQGAILEGNLSNITLLDVTPLSLGIETFGGLMNVIIPRNTTIPKKSGELFTNAIAGQEKMKITLLQGERELAKDNWKLGELELDFAPVPKGKARVGVQFAIDVNGILQVLARDVTSGKEKIIEITHAVDVSDEAVEAMIADSLEHAFEDRDARLFTEAKLKAEEMLPAVEKALSELTTLLPVETEAAVRAGTMQVQLALERQELEPLQKALQELDEATQTLATLLVEQAMKR